MEPVMPQIETVVMLMLENRSLDAVLGWLHEGETLPPERIFPPGSSDKFDGITTEMFNDFDGERHRPPHGTQDNADPWRTPRWNPYEVFDHVTTQFYADGEGRLTGTPWSDPPTMSGFVYDFAQNDWVGRTDLAEVMCGYTAAQLPVLYGLAENFAVSDRWFSSVPTETNPNRAFSLCGTALGAADNADIKFFDAPTLFNRLTDIPWAVYWQYHGFEDLDPLGPYRDCFTEDLFPQLHQAAVAGDGVVTEYSNFLDALRAGEDIPRFCYIEPFSSGGYGLPVGDGFIGLQGNDYHSPAWIGQGEYDLNELYTLLRASKQWESMMFVVVFDEHGGTWDHVAPPRTVAPDDSPGRFGFDWLGARVPMIVASPFVRPGSVFRAADGRDFDHTSLLATLLKWAGVDPAEADMGARVAQAPTFESIVGSTRYDSPPTFDVPESYATQGGPKGLKLDLHRYPHVDRLAASLAKVAETGGLADRLLHAVLRRR